MTKQKRLNREWILAHLREAKEELDRTIDNIENDEKYDEIKFRIAMLHLYSHLNTAWNERKGEIDVEHDDAELFPKDMARYLRAMEIYSKLEIKPMRRVGRGKVMQRKKINKILEEFLEEG